MLARELLDYGMKANSLIESYNLIFRDFENVGLVLDHHRMELLHFSNNLGAELGDLLNFEYIKASWKNTRPMDLERLFMDHSLLERIQELVKSGGGVTREMEVIKERNYSVVFTKTQFDKRVDRAKRRMGLAQNAKTMGIKNKLFSALRKASVIISNENSEEHLNELDNTFNSIDSSIQNSISRRQTLVSLKILTQGIIGTSVLKTKFSPHAVPGHRPRLPLRKAVRLRPRVPQSVQRAQKA